MSAKCMIGNFGASGLRVCLYVRIFIIDIIMWCNMLSTFLITLFLILIVGN